MQSKEDTYWSPWSKSTPLRDEEKLIKHGVVSHYRLGDVIFQQGDPCSDSLFYLYAGRVVIHTVGITGEQKTHHILEKGALIGEASFFVQNVHIAAAIARENCTVVKLSKQVLRKLFLEDRDLPFNLMLMLSRKIYQLASQVDDLSYLTIDQRLVRLLLKFAEDFGQDEEEGIMLPESITDEDLGKLVGARRETVSRVLSSLRDAGIVSKVRRKFYVRDLSALRDYLNRNC